MNDVATRKSLPKEGQLDLFSFDDFLSQVNASPTTGWRRRQQGKIKAISIGGRLYVTPADIAEFGRRAKAGEFKQKNRLDGKKRRVTTPSKVRG